MNDLQEKIIKLKKEKNMGTQVELNTKIKKLSDRIKDIIEK